MNSTILEIDLLQCFLAVVQTGGFTKAGDKIGLTQSGVSIKIKRLEGRLDTKLFTRTSKSLALTPEGELLKGYAQRIINLHNEALQRFVTPMASGTLRIGIEDYFVPSLLSPLLSQFRQHHPNIHLEVTMGNGITLIPLYKEGALDLVVTGDCSTTLTKQTLLKAPLVWIFGQDYELPDTPCIPLAVFSAPCCFRTQSTEALNRAGKEWVVKFTGNSVVSIQAAVEAGLGISALPVWALTEKLRKAPASYNLPDLPQHKLVLFADDNDINPAKSLFIDFIKVEMAKLLM
ncbi:LysR family transcriptional regulator [Halodesulfovibrio sp. MK-HDV]|jgi:DNA-binding transcriptional LysR family regulator|uniref:LysR family transcriptional regulator n=1 Tax=Halodesulfovibrio sp. MK-HDV TaxID=2599925 RepID=UPI00136E45AC|nr:LysR family transcriptional regulator [Halodesulfovibrio sp. MK-HDV]KAF1076046.1 HTH-type transcriptional regulator GltR [Halodesulfovibrio sp. MK-HDV]